MNGPTRAVFPRGNTELLVRHIEIHSHALEESAGNSRHPRHIRFRSIELRLVLRFTINLPLIQYVFNLVKSDDLINDSGHVGILDLSDAGHTGTNIDDLCLRVILLSDDFAQGDHGGDDGRQVANELRGELLDI